MLRMKLQHNSFICDLSTRTKLPMSHRDFQNCFVVCLFEAAYKQYFATGKGREFFSMYVTRIQQALTLTLKLSWFKTWCFIPFEVPFSLNNPMIFGLNMLKVLMKAAGSYLRLNLQLSVEGACRVLTEWYCQGPKKQFSTRTGEMQRIKRQNVSR